MMHQKKNKFISLFNLIGGNNISISVIGNNIYFSEYMSLLIMSLHCSKQLGYIRILNTIY